MPESKTQQTARKLVMKNKLLFICCMLFIMLSLFMVCYLFFFRTITMDITKNIDIIYTGESGTASVEVKNMDTNMNQRTQEFLDSITYLVAPKSNLSNGTIITIQATYSKELAQKYNIEVMNKTRDITVEGLAQRYEDATAISDSFYQTIDSRSESYFERNISTIIKEDFHQFYVTSNTQYKDKERIHRLFLQAVNAQNKDKIIDVYKINATGKVNQATDKEDLIDKEEFIYYVVTYDNINNSENLKDEDVYGERLLTDQDVSDVEVLLDVLQAKYVLNYQMSIVE